MFRNPRENIGRAPDEYALPSLGRPPSPPRSSTSTTATTPRMTILAPQQTASMASLGPAPMPTIGRGSTTPRKSQAAALKAKGKPNGNILAFFKKSEEEEQALFVQSRGLSGGHVGISHASTAGDEWLEAKENRDERDKDSDGPVKRRKVSTTATATEGNTGVRHEDLSSGVSYSSEHDVKSEPNQGEACIQLASQPSASRTQARGLFMEESDSEDDATEVESTKISTTFKGRDQGVHSEVAAPEEDKQIPTAAVPPPLPRDETSVGFANDFAEFQELGDFDEDVFEEGDEAMERRWMEEQAMLEADNDDYDDERADIVDLSGANDTPCETSPTCPICSIALSNVSDQDAAVHVNNCLDGNPTPLPVKQIASPVKRSDSAETPKQADRFRKQPRAPKPGQASPFTFGETPGRSGSAFSKLMSGKAEDAAWADAAASEKASFGKPAYQRMCPFYKILPGFNICVDAFRYGAVEGCRAYFLSHFHSDHYIGLTAQWCHGPIYCSKVTANLVKQQLRVDPKFVIALDWEVKVEVPGSNGVQVTMISANHCPGSSLYLFEKVVGHGSNPKVQRVLHCGDFRACRMHVEHPLLRPEVQDAVSGKKRDQKIDVCYLDTTYLNPRYAFPSQEAVIRACADMCVSLSKVRADEKDGWETMKRDRAGAGMVKFIRQSSNMSDVKSEEVVIKQEEQDIEGIKEEKPEKELLDAMTVMKRKNEKYRGRLLVIVGTYSIGKERICMGIARALNSKIYAPPGKLKICRALEDPELEARLTSDPTEAQVHMTPLFEIRADTLDDYLKDYKDHFSRAVGFRPSGWNYRPPNSRFTDSPNVATVLHSDNWRSTYSMKELVPQRGSTSRASCFGVPYSEHSSFRELTMFCTALKIDKIIPTVNVGNAKSREKMKGWCEKWAMERKKNGLFKLRDDEEWHLIRRAALRSLQAQIVQAPTRTFASRTSAITRPSTQQAISWTGRKFYSQEKTDDADAEATAAEHEGEVEGEAAKEEQTVGETLSDAAETVKEAASSAVNTASDALSSAFGGSGSSRGGSSNFQPDQSDKGRVLYVGNLYFDLTPEALREKFETVGKVTNVRIVSDQSGVSKGFGYIEFEHAEDAENAIRRFDQQELEGRRMAVQFHVKKERGGGAGGRSYQARNPPSRTLFVGNMAFSMSDHELNELFRAIKGVQDVRVAIDRKTGQPRGFAHADFADVESAVAAKKELEGKSVHGRQLRIDFGLPSTLVKQPRDRY